MGLGNFSGEDESKSSDSRNGGGSRKYVKISKQEFEEFLDTLPVAFEPVTRDPSGEYVYQTTGAPLEVDNVRIRVYSTIQKGSDTGRGKGDDAIRTVLYDIENREIVGGRKKTLRIESWRSNLEPKIMELADEAQSMITKCAVCNKGWLREVDGQYGEFLGCSNYPDCEFMCYEYEDGKFIARTSKDGTAEFANSRQEAREKLWDELNSHV